EEDEEDEIMVIEEEEEERAAVNIDALWRDFMSDYTAGVGIEMAEEIIHNIVTDPEYVEAMEEGEEDEEQLFFDHFVNQIEMNTVSTRQNAGTVMTLYDYVRRKSVMRRMMKKEEKMEKRSTVDKNKTNKGAKESQKGAEKSKNKKVLKPAVTSGADEAAGSTRKRKICHDPMGEVSGRVRRATNSSQSSDALPSIVSVSARPNTSRPPPLPLPSPPLAQSSHVLSRPSTSAAHQLQLQQQTTPSSLLRPLGDARQRKPAAAAAATSTTAAAAAGCYDPRRVQKKPMKMEFVRHPPDYDVRPRLVCGPLPIRVSPAEIKTQFASLPIPPFVFTRYEGNVYMWLKAVNYEQAARLLQFRPFQVGNFSASIYRPGTILVEVSRKMVADYLSLILSRYGQLIGLEAVGGLNWKATFLEFKEAKQAIRVGMEKVNGGYTVKYHLIYPPGGVVPTAGNATATALITNVSPISIASTVSPQPIASTVSTQSI
ncbi:hypothetical protein PFISCL1PPCAC_862, partial [Pristionchus fissidentatus]